MLQLLDQGEQPVLEDVLAAPHSVYVQQRLVEACGDLRDGE